VASLATWLGRSMAALWTGGCGGPPWTGAKLSRARAVAGCRATARGVGHGEPCRGHGRDAGGAVELVRALGAADGGPMRAVARLDGDAELRRARARGKRGREGALRVSLRSW
jgi:hypothetical protein